MTPFLRKLLGLNWLLLANMLALAVFGVIAIYSATYMREDPIATEFWRKQANWVAVGFLAFMVTSLIDYRWIRWGALPMYFAGLVFLILTQVHRLEGLRRDAAGCIWDRLIFSRRSSPSSPASWCSRCF